MLVLIFSDEVWIDILPWWIWGPAFVGLIAQLATDSKIYKWLFDKHETVSKAVAKKAIWGAVALFLMSRLISLFM